MICPQIEKEGFHLWQRSINMLGTFEDKRITFKVNLYFQGEKVTFTITLDHLLMPPPFNGHLNTLMCLFLLLGKYIVSLDVI